MKYTKRKVGNLFNPDGSMKSEKQLRNEYLAVLKKRWKYIELHLPVIHPFRKSYPLSVMTKDMEALRRLYDQFRGHVRWFESPNAGTLVISVELKMGDYDDTYDQDIA